MGYWFPTAFSAWDAEEKEAILRVVDSGQFTMGEETLALESEIAAYHGRKHAVAVNSGSSANLMAVAAISHLMSTSDQGHNWNIAAVPALAWATTYAPLVQHGYDLAVQDCGDSWNVEASRIGDTRIAVLCPVLGNPSHVDMLASVYQRSSVWVLNDCCESLGAEINGRPVGGYGDLATLSFFYSHQIGAIEGGVILTDSDLLNRLMRMLRDHGMTRWDKPIGFENEYDFRLMGYNVRTTEIHSAVARVQLRKLPQMIEARRNNYYVWREMTDGLPITHPRPLGDISPFGLPFCCENGKIWRKLVNVLRAAGIDCRPPTGGSLRRHVYGERWAHQPTPNADRIHETGMLLGCPPFPAEDKIETVVTVMRSVL